MKISGPVHLLIQQLQHVAYSCEHKRAVVYKGKGKLLDPFWSAKSATIQ